MTSETVFCTAEILPRRPENGAGQDSAKTGTLPRFCPAHFVAGQDATKPMKSNVKTPCPARGKVAGQNSANHSAPPRGSLYRRARWGKMGQTEEDMASEQLSFAVIQFDPNGDDFRDETRLGVLVPVNMDGFYRDEADAVSVASYMASERTHLTTLMVKVIAAVKL